MKTLPKSLRKKALTVANMPEGKMYYVLPWELYCDKDGVLTIKSDVEVHLMLGGTVEVGIVRSEGKLSVYIPRGIDYRWEEEKLAHADTETIDAIYLVYGVGSPGRMVY